VLRALLKVLAMFIVFAGVAGAIVFLTCKYQAPCREAKHQDATQTPTPSVLADSQAHPREGDKDADKGPDCVPCRYKLLAWPEGITAWAILATLFVVGWQSWETRRAAQAGQSSVAAVEHQSALMKRQADLMEQQNKATRDKERARIMVSVSRLEKLHIGIDPGNRIFIHVENVGPTQAQNVRGEAEAVAAVDGFDFLDSMDAGDQDLVIPNVLRPNQSPIETWAFFFIPDEWSEEIGIVNPRIAITLHGSVRYEDIFGDNHVTPFNYRLSIPRTLKWAGNDVAEVPPLSRWRPIDAETNRAT
jgi:hypothetical protein